MSISMLLFIMHAYLMPFAVLSNAACLHNAYLFIIYFYLDVKSFPRQSRFRGGGIATVYKSTLGSNITFKTNFDFAHTSFEVV